MLGKGVNTQAKIIFLKVLSSTSKSDIFLRLYSIFGDELLLFLSLFHGENIHIPNIPVIQRLLEHSQIYEVLSRGGFTEEAYQACSKLFSRRRCDLDVIVARVQGSLKEVEALVNSGGPSGEE